MKSIELTKEILTAEYGDEASLKDVFQKLENRLQQDGNVICQFIVNGMELSEADEQKFSQSTLKDIEKIGIKFQKPAELVTSIVDNWCQELPQIIAHGDSIVFTWRKEGLEKHFNAFIKQIDRCQMLVESLISLDQLCKAHSVVRSESWKIAEQLLAQAIGDSLKAFQNKDYVLVCDITEYDLGHSLQLWVDNLKILREQLKSGISI